MEKILTFDEIKKCILGAERFLISNDTLHPCRFTENEQESYRNNPDFYRKTFSNSNMIISFFTDAEKVILKYEAKSASSRVFCYLDAKVDGIMVGHSGLEDVRNSSTLVMELPLAGKKCKVEIFLPPLAEVAITELILENATFFDAAPRKKFIISYGDSITQGYDAKFPACSYTALLAEELEAELINKAIGGDIYNPSLVKAGKNTRKVDLVTTAYGTNDWSKCARKDLFENCENFFAALTQLYPATPIAALLPIWRKDHARETLAGNFFEVRNEMRKIMEKYPDIHVIDGLSLTPHVEDFYSDAYLHPNDPGFMFMGENLIKELKKSIPSLWS